MLDHHLQRAIVYRLAFSDALRFGELKPDTLENKLFDYHLKKVVAAGYVTKTEDGLYGLSPEGRRLGIRMLDRQAFTNQADSVLFLVVRRAIDDAWLLYERSSFPMRGYGGFMHALPNANEPTTASATQALRDYTGLSGNFTALGGGYFRIFNQSGALESFTNFTLLYCDDATGELDQRDEFASYHWELTPDFTAVSFFPSTAILHDLYLDKQPFFVERDFVI